MKASKTELPHPVETVGKATISTELVVMLDSPKGISTPSFGMHGYDTCSLGSKGSDSSSDTK
ncbi:hypothetical protein E2C01_046391 [Portunus trituberculatus]|uniref:Uncharacterized protein n=1 Tax=Portunus trituberculatus TaxID=210409 RepID=A0A5B7FXR9_PORTR|nr:hypothetical protein [Portunus trituberculatus]